MHTQPEGNHQHQLTFRLSDLHLPVPLQLASLGSSIAGSDHVDQSSPYPSDPAPILGVDFGTMPSSTAGLYCQNAIPLPDLTSQLSEVRRPVVPAGVPVIPSLLSHEPHTLRRQAFFPSESCPSCSRSSEDDFVCSSSCLFFTWSFRRYTIGE